ncbi:hypothetical protein BACFIN_05612 [Bacteroides finegoldii DSM 17565]|nr:hypothetical protein BACFIN_05612 [Bacteroides finegoldii DSM 17565]
MEENTYLCRGLKKRLLFFFSLQRLFDDTEFMNGNCKMEAKMN